MPAPLPRVLRDKVIAAFQQTKASSVALAERFGVSQSFTSRLIRRYKADGQVSPKPHAGGRPPTISVDLHDEIRRLARQSSAMTAKEIAAAIKAQRGFKPSPWVIWRVLKKLGFSRKKLTFEANERRRPDVQKKRKSFKKAAVKVDRSRLVFLDETGVNGSMTQSTGWAPIGERAFQTRSLRNRRNVTVIGAVRSSGLVAMRSLDGGMKKKDFISFVTDVLCPRLHAGDILVMDNLAAHHASEVVASVANRGASVAFLPPYSPDLNPIEMLWNSLKRRFEKRFRQAVQKVRRAVGGCWRSLKDLDFDKFLPPCGYTGPSLCNR